MREGVNVKPGAPHASDAAGMFVGGVLSRTTGLPGFYEAEWEPLLLASLVLELVYVALYVTVRRPQRSTV